MDHTSANLTVNAPASAGPVLAPAEGEDVLHCRACGYDLRTLPAGRCPECGLMFNPADVVVADIPWLRRATIGTWRAYWATVWLGVTRPGRMARAAHSNVNVAPTESARFANTCIIAAVGSFACALTTAAWNVETLLAILATVPAQAAFVWAAHQAVVTLDWRLHGAAYLDRLTRLKPFTAAPLGAAPLVAAMLAALIACARFGGRGTWLAPVALVVLAAPFAILFAWWCVAVAFHASAPGVRAMHAMVYGIAVASVWAALAVATGLVAGACVELFDLVGPL